MESNEERREAPRPVMDTELRDIVRQTVKDTLTTLGVDLKNPIQMQKDFQHLRDWREASDSIKTKGMLTFVGILVTGIIGAFVLGIKDFFN